MQQETSPLCAADISPDLRKGFAFLSGETDPPAALAAHYHFTDPFYCRTASHDAERYSLSKRKWPGFVEKRRTSMHTELLTLITVSLYFPHISCMINILYWRYYIQYIWSAPRREIWARNSCYSWPSLVQKCIYRPCWCEVGQIHLAVFHVIGVPWESIVSIIYL